MARIVGYIASSLDGYVATMDDRVDWLDGYEGMDLGEHDAQHFMARIRTVVMGRATYDFVERAGVAWPYAEHRAYVVTSRPIAAPVGALEIRSDVDALIAELRALDDGDV